MLHTARNCHLIRSRVTAWRKAPPSFFCSPSFPLPFVGRQKVLRFSKRLPRAIPTVSTVWLGLAWLGAEIRTGDPSGGGIARGIHKSDHCLPTSIRAAAMRCLRQSGMLPQHGRPDPQLPINRACRQRVRSRKERDSSKTRVTAAWRRTCSHRFL